jgi:hypothetical protein
MIIPTDLNVKGISNNNKINEVDSPLYRKRKVQNYLNFFEQSKIKD